MTFLSSFFVFWPGFDYRSKCPIFSDKTDNDCYLDQYVFMGVFVSGLIVGHFGQNTQSDRYTF